jgi:hypothetical protein
MPVSPLSSIETSGSWVATTSAKIATRTRNPRMTIPARADRWRRMFRRVSPHRFEPRALTSGSALRSGSGATAISPA